MTGSVRLSLAAAVATLLAVVGLRPVIADGSWGGPAVVCVVLVAGIGIGLRALRIPAWGVLASQAVALVIWIGHLVAGDVARLGWLPSRAWAERLGETFVSGIETVRADPTPVPLDDGILLLVLAGVAITALSVDALAVTAMMAPLAGIPLAVVHTVAMATSPTGPSAWAFVAAAGGYLGLLVVDGRERAARWGRPLGSSTTSGRASPPAGLSAVGWPLAIGAVAIAVAGATVLPEGGVAVFGGPQSGGGSGGQSIRTQNPIVDLKRDLVQPENVDVIRFTSETSSPDYLRLLTLDVYDGTVWRTSDRPVPEANRVEDGLPTPPGLGDDVATTEASYRFEATESLESQWLPLPYPAAEVQPEDGDWRYDAGTLDVVSTDRTTSGLRYDVTALEVEPTPEQLGGLPPLPDRFTQTLEIPNDLPPEVRDLAREVTVDAVDNYERAVALQDWYRSDGGFVYDLAVQPGNGSDDLLAFLEERRGYCEQFAASMAIMARVLGIPSRVAVGYLRGEQEQPGYWVVRAQDAHAWPELYFDNVGWVRFEPTPAGRTGAAPAYTQPDSPEAVVPESLSDAVPDAGDSELGGRPDNPLDESGALADAASRPTSLPFIAVVVTLLLLALSPLLAGLVARRRRWSGTGNDPARQAEAAWADIQDAALEVGLSRGRHETVRVAAAQLGDEASLPPDTRERLDIVARATERARYAATATPVEGLQDDAAAVRQALVQGSPRSTRWRAAWWPAPVRRWLRRPRLF